MRPLELEMTAFGSYAEHTTVPFEKLRHGLYLVTGDTGAGKTTIFDAIAFALYGKASGSDRDNVGMLHSDFVAKSVDTLVKLRFRQGGKEYAVVRSIHFVKKRGEANAYGDPKVEATLTEPDRAPTEGATRVTARVEALLGLNAEQFRKIIMLPQGEFREFLKADSEKKGEILGKLFDSAPYLWYQNLIDGARKALEARRADKKRELAVLMESGFRRPDGLSEAEAELYLPEHPALIENLSRLAAGEEEALAALDKTLDGAQKELDALNTKKGAAEGVNRQLDELAQLTAHAEALTAAAETYARRREVRALAEKALRRALPAIEAQARAEQVLAGTEAEIVRDRQALEALRQALARAKDDAAQDADLRKALEGVAVELQQIGEQLPLYDELERQARERDAALKRAAAAAEAVKADEKALTETDAALEALQAQIQALDGVDVAVMAANNRLKEAGERYKALKGLDADVRKLVQDEAQLEAEERKRVQLAREALAARERHLALYRRFVAGQAGLLADDLREKIDETGEAVCPVCGTALGRAQWQRLAVHTADTPDQEAVDRAKELADAQEEARSAQQSRTERLAAALQSSREALVTRARQWLPACAGWEELRAPACLEAALDAALREGQAARTEANARAADQKRRDEARALAPQKEAQQKELRERQENARRAIEELNAEAKKQEALMAAAQTRLRWPDRAAAQAAQKEAAGRQAALNATLEQHRAALERAQKHVSDAEGGLREKQNARARQAAECEAAREALDGALTAAGFPDAEAARRALPPIGGGDGEAWLRAEQKALDDYDHDRDHTAERLEDLRAQTEGRVRVDLEALDRQLAEAAARRDRLNDEHTARQGLLENHRSILARAAEIRRALQASEGAWRRIDKLADLKRTQSGTVTFDRYVIGAVFQEVLELANLRLERMSGGKYELVLRTGASRANSKAGLDLEVLDNTTGQRRPSGSLSGGEAFFTSLSLALGLSDAVQRNAGGRRMDALFIDEGFGSLSDDALDKALEVLNQLTEGNRLVGIISHVDKLDESIPQKIRVHGGKAGSRIDPIA